MVTAMFGGRATCGPRIDTVAAVQDRNIELSRPRELRRGVDCRGAADDDGAHLLQEILQLEKQDSLILDEEDTHTIQPQH